MRVKCCEFNGIYKFVMNNIQEDNIDPINVVMDQYENINRSSQNIFVSPHSYFCTTNLARIKALILPKICSNAFSYNRHTLLL